MNFVFDKLSRKKRSCHDCIYLESACLFGPTFSITSYTCKVYGNDIEPKEVNTKSCWRFGRRKEGIPIERQIYDHWVNRLKRNWFYIIVAISTIIGLIITIVKAFNII